MMVIAAVLLAVYTTAIAALVLSPNRIDGDGLGVYRVLYDLYEDGLPRWVTYGVVEVAANVAVMIPFAALLAIVLPRRLWWAAALACSAVSLSVELTQALMPNRMPSLSDWTANTLGGFVGAVCTVPFRRPQREVPA